MRPASLIVAVALIILCRPAAAQSPPPAAASTNPQALEMVAAWQGSQHAPTSAERIALIEKALKLAQGFNPWPFKEPARDDLLARMWGQLGNEYRRVQAAQRADALESAVRAYTESLKVRGKRDADWARAQYGLGLVYRDRVRGDRADNLERAIAAFTSAGEVLTRTGAPDMWGSIQVGLSSAYWHRIKGLRADNLEQAIAAGRNALAVLPREKFRDDWIGAQQALGAAYWARVRGSRADNVEAAIAAYEQAATAVSRERQPKVWAGLKDNLGMAYGERPRGERGDNIEKAIAAFTAAGDVFTREAFPADWAQLQMNLGIAYSEREAGRRADNIEAAVVAFGRALLFYTPEQNPEKWARTMLNLGTAYSDRIIGDRASNTELAIEAYDNALRVYKREADPGKWAIARYNLGIAYRERSKGPAARNLELAAAALADALSVHTPGALPRQHLRTARWAGEVAAARGDWSGANAHFSSAIAASTRLFGEGLNAAEAESVVRDGAQLFASAAYAAAQLKQPERALDLLEAGRARLLKVSLGLDALALAAADRSKLDQLRGDIRDAESRLELTSGEERLRLVKELETLRRSVQGVAEAAAARAGDAPTRSGAAALTDAALQAHAAIVAPIVTDHGARLLIAVAGAKGPTIKTIELPGLTTATLSRFMTGGDGTGTLAGWFGAYAINYLPAAEQQARHGGWLKAIDELGPALWTMVAARLAEALDAERVPRQASIVWLPQGALGALPIALARDPASGETLLDRYNIVLAPSLAALESSTRRAQAERASPSLAAVVNPTGDLAFTAVEGAAAASYFDDAQRAVLGADTARAEPVLAALKTASYWHFATHGTFSWSSARASALVLAGQERLTVARLLDQVGLGHPRLVVLSACETGLYDFRRAPDEFVGLPTAFLQLGAAGVVATLWPVDDVSTSLAMIKFYDLQFRQRLAPAAALRQAQLWLRGATREELREFVGDLRRSGRLMSEHEATLKSVLQTGRDQDRPFAHPFYWAPFQFLGA